MPSAKRRRSGATRQEVPDDESDSTPARTQGASRRRGQAPADERDPDNYNTAEDVMAMSDEGDDGENAGDDTHHQQQVKNLVRLAICNEFSRQPLRRADINAKALGGKSRQFARVFADAQHALQHTFGMELRELPLRDKGGMAGQHRHIATQSAAAGVSSTQGNSNAAMASQAGNSSNKSWILVSTLPEQYYVSGLIEPPMAPTRELESAYIGLYTFVVAVIMLSGGALPEAKLERHLKRCNAEQNTPVDRTDKLLARMVREGYVQRIKDTSSGEEITEYVVGPRGKAEVGEKGVEGVVRAIYGDAMDEEMEKKLQRSLDFNRPLQRAETRHEGTDGDEAGGRGVGRSRGRRNREDDDDNEDDDMSDR